MITFITKMDGTPLRIFHTAYDFKEMTNYLHQNNMKLNVDYKSYTIPSGWKDLRQV